MWLLLFSQEHVPAACHIHLDAVLGSHPFLEIGLNVDVKVRISSSGFY